MMDGGNLKLIINDVYENLKKGYHKALSCNSLPGVRKITVHCKRDGKPTTQ